MAATLHILPATSDDLDTLVRLNGEVQNVHVPLAPDYFKPIVDPAALRAFFESRLLDERQEILLAKDGEKALGYIWLEIQDRPETELTYPWWQLHIHHLCVTASARRQHVASQLMHYAETRAREAGIRRIAASAWAANEVAQDFFRAQGFSASTLTLRKMLD